MIITLCVVIATAALVPLAIVTIRAMIRFEKMAEQVEKTAVLFSESMIEFKAAARDMHTMVASLDEAVDPLRRAATELGRVGSRAAALSTAVLEELVVPIRAVIGIVRGFRAGAGYFTDRVADRRRGDEPRSGQRATPEASPQREAPEASP
jgi:hypothetical protein